MLPVRRAFDLQMHPSLHADSPMFPTEGFCLMQTATARQISDRQVLNAAQAITVQQACSLEVGKWVDLQIVDQNPYAVAAGVLRGLIVEVIYVAGLRP